MPSRPLPGLSRTSLGGVSASPCPRAAATSAVATTWFDAWSSEAARRSTSFSAKPFSGWMADSDACPWVSVPVLSMISVRTSASTSSPPPPLISTPMRAARDTPAMIATGTARISGQGVATTITASQRTGSPEASHAAPAMASVATRKTMAKRSAIRTIGARARAASSTRRTMPA